MKADFDIDVKWFGQAATEKVLKQSMKGLKRAGMLIADDAHRKAPVLSGTLARSICVTEGGVPELQPIFAQAKETKGNKTVPVEEKQGDEIAVYVTANTPYAHKQHEKNRNHSKFLERALQENKEKIEKYVKQELKKL